jgi:poly-gamma-glutamate synthesis protein (capsule biosynthesis protein)
MFLEKRKNNFFDNPVLWVIVALLVGVFSCKFSTNETKTVEVEQEDSITVVRIIAAGDAMAHMPQINAAKMADGSYDFSGCYQYITDILATGDLNIVNLETTLAGAPYSGYPLFSAPDEYAIALRDAGFNFFLLANNHIADKGTRGATTTIEKLHEMQVSTAGAYSDDEDREKRNPAIVEVEGIKIALLNYTYSLNGMTVSKPFSVNLLDDTIQIKKDLEEARNRQADVIIVFPHWGEEYQHTPSRRQREQARFFFKNGADIIIGSHPHVVQPVEYFAYDQTDTTKTKLIYWSLGNFISNQRFLNAAQGGILASLTITKNKNTNQSQIENHSAIPFWVYRNREISPGYFVLPAEQFLNDTTIFQFSKEDRDAFQLFVNNTNKILEK